MWQSGGAVHPDGQGSRKGVGFVSSQDASLSPQSAQLGKPNIFSTRAAPAVEVDKDPVFAPDPGGSDKSIFHWESQSEFKTSVIAPQAPLGERIKEFWSNIRPIPLDSWWFEKWTWVCVAAALLTGWVAPFLMAFEGLPESDGLEWTVVQWTLVVIFVVDVLSRFVLEYEDPDTGMRVQEYSRIALFYAKNMLVYDVVFLIPWSTVISSALGLRDGETDAALLLGLLRLLQLGRMYRFSAFIAMLEYRMILPQTAIVVLRNNLYVLGSSHVAGCMFFLIARLKQFRGDTWVGRHADRFEGIGLFGKYAYSLYFALAAFTGLGDNDFYIASVAEACVMGIYLLFNMLLAAYILGTVTMLMVKGDKRMKQFRDRVTNLREYGKLNSVPPRLMAAMEAHTELHFHNDSASDEQVLSIYPQTIRRRVLRHLYMEAVQSCYLFHGCNAKYLDLVLSLGRAEQFMPSEQLVAEGDMVNEIFVILEGEAEVTTGGQMPASLANMIGGGDTGGKNKTVTRALSTAALKRAKTTARSNKSSNMGFDESSHRNRSNMGTSERGDLDLSLALSLPSTTGTIQNSRASRTSHFDINALMDSIARSQTQRMDDTILHAGRCFGQTSFFSDTSSHCSVWSKTIIKVLVISRSVYQELLKTYPQQTRKVLDNMEEEAEGDVRQQILNAIAGHKNLNRDLVAVLHELAIGDKRPSELPASIMMEIHSKLDPSQRLQVDNLSKVKECLAQYVRKVDQEIVYQFLNNCSDGDEAAVRAALAGGMSPNAADYDKRTGLMLACLQGHEGLVHMLLEAGADPNLVDNAGRTALRECVKLGRDSLVEILLAYGASLSSSSDDDGSMQASVMCEHIKTGNLNQLERLLRAGANANVCDYNDMTPLHVACLCSNLAAVQLLVTQGQVELGSKNAWGRTALEEAQRLGDKSIIDFLEPLTTAAVTKEEQIGKDLDFLNACMHGRLNQVQAALKAGQSPDTGDHSQRTALMFACFAGHASVAKLLLHEGADPSLKDMEGHTAMWESIVSHHPALVDVLLEYGGTLGSVDIELAALWGQNLAENQLHRLLLMLRAGADPEVDDYQGSKPLHVAAMLGNLLAVRLLIEEANAVPDAVDGFGRTAVECARAAQAIKDDPSFHDEVIAYLDPIVDAAIKGQIRNRENPAAPPAILLVKDMCLPRVKDLIKPQAMRRISTLSTAASIPVFSGSFAPSQLGGISTRTSVTMGSAAAAPELYGSESGNVILKLPHKGASIRKQVSVDISELEPPHTIPAHHPAGLAKISPHPTAAALTPGATGVTSILRTGSLRRPSTVQSSSGAMFKDEDWDREDGNRQPQPLLVKAASLTRSNRRASVMLPPEHRVGAISPTAQVMLDQVDKELGGLLDMDGIMGALRPGASFKMPASQGSVAGPSTSQPVGLAKPLDAHVSSALLKRARRASVKMDHNAQFMQSLMAAGSNDPLGHADDAIAEYQQLLQLVAESPPHAPPRVPAFGGLAVSASAESPAAGVSSKTEQMHEASDDVQAPGQPRTSDGALQDEIESYAVKSNPTFEPVPDSDEVAAQADTGVTGQPQAEAGADDDDETERAITEIEQLADKQQEQQLS